MRILVTGGAGFIGSHLCDRLLKEGHSVICIDDLSLGNEKNIKHNYDNPNFTFIKLDLLKLNGLKRLFKNNKIECVFHLAANSDIEKGSKDRQIDLNKNFLTTFNILECMKEYEVKQLVFTSTSAIYGNVVGKISEDHGPAKPISFYGASKLAAEAFITTYSHHFEIKTWIFRFPNVIGDRATHGAAFDFIKRLKKDPTKLVVLGDGTQTKPYVYVDDLVEAVVFAWKNSNELVNVFNIGCDSKTSVAEIVKIVLNESGLKNVKVKYTGGKIGWIGDVPSFEYDLSKINRLGWKAKYNSNEAVRMAVKRMLRE